MFHGMKTTFIFNLSHVCFLEIIQYIYTVNSALTWRVSLKLYARIGSDSSRWGTKIEWFVMGNVNVPNKSLIAYTTSTTTSYISTRCHGLKIIIV